MRTAIKMTLVLVGLVWGACSSAKTIAETEPNDYEEYQDWIGLTLSKWMPQQLGSLSGAVTINGQIGTDRSETTWGDLFQFTPSKSGHGTVVLEGACGLSLYDCSYFGAAGCSFDYAMATTRFILREQVGRTPIDVEFGAGNTYFLRVQSSSSARYSIKMSLPGNDPVPDPTPYLTISPSSDSRSSSSGTGTISVSANVSWTASSDSSWLTITGGSSGSGSGTISFRYLANASTSGRTGSISVRGSSVSRSFSLYQSGAEPLPQPKTYTVWYRPGTYGTGSATYDTKKENVSLTLRGALFSRTGYDQCGWSTSPAGSSKSYDLYDSYTQNAGTTLYPYWVAKAPKTCKLTLIRNDGAGTLETRTYTQGVKSYLPTIASLGWARRGYDFVGWAPDTDWASAGLVWAVDGDTFCPSGGQTAIDGIAVWKLKPGYYQIRFNKNDGTGKWRSLAYEYGTATALPSCGSAGLGWARSDYVFCGWATSAAKAAAGEVWRDDRGVTKTPVAVGKTLGLYAIWRKPSEIYGIRFIRNDGAGTLQTMRFSYGSYTSLPTVASLGWSRRGYDFLGWSSGTADAAAGWVWLYDGQSVAYDVPAGTTRDAIASWKLKPGYYQIRFNKNDGTGKWRTLAYEYGKSTALPTCAAGLGWTRRGYAFRGWASSAANASSGILWREDKTSVATAIGIGKTLSVYAMWEKVPKTGL